MTPPTELLTVTASDKTGTGGNVWRGHCRSFLTRDAVQNVNKQTGPWTPALSPPPHPPFCASHHHRSSDRPPALPGSFVSLHSLSESRLTEQTLILLKYDLHPAFPRTKLADGFSSYLEQISVCFFPLNSPEARTIPGPESEFAKWGFDG